jgi:hypothetical protein
MFLQNRTLMTSLLVRRLQITELMRSVANDALNISCLMLAIMSPDLQKQYEHVDAYTMIQGLRGIFENQARTERYNISKVLFACKLAEGSPASPLVIKMMSYIDTWTKLGCEIKDDLATDVILQSLPMSYELFIMNFHMNGMEKTMFELHVMLKTVEDSIKKNPQSCDDSLKGEEKEEALDASQGQRQGKGFR